MCKKQENIAEKLRNTDYGFSIGDKVICEYIQNDDDKKVRKSVKGVIEGITEFLFTVMTDKGYRLTVSKKELYCGQVILKKR